MHTRTIFLPSNIHIERHKQTAEQTTYNILPTLKHPMHHLSNQASQHSMLPSMHIEINSPTLSSIIITVDATYQSTHSYQRLHICEQTGSPESNPPSHQRTNKTQLSKPNIFNHNSSQHSSYDITNKSETDQPQKTNPNHPPSLLTIIHNYLVQVPTTIQGYLLQHTNTEYTVQT